MARRIRRSAPKRKAPKRKAAPKKRKSRGRGLGQTLGQALDTRVANSSIGQLSHTFANLPDVQALKTLTPGLHGLGLRRKRTSRGRGLWDKVKTAAKVAIPLALAGLIAHKGYRTYTKFNNMDTSIQPVRLY